MRRILILIATLVASLLITPAAQADTPRCVSRTEYKQAVNSTYPPTQQRVEEIFDISGSVTHEESYTDADGHTWRYVTMVYRKCDGWNDGQLVHAYYDNELGGTRLRAQSFSTGENRPRDYVVVY